MSDAVNEKPTTTFWIIGVAFLFWNLVGLMFYYLQMTTSPEVMAESYSPDQVDFITSTPVWATSAYAIAVTAGALGAAMLLLRRTVAVPLFVVSFVAVLVQDLDAFVLRGALQLFGGGALVLPSIVIIICIAEIWYSRSAKSKGWLA